jgi:predicted O-methyltransferase YrrM
MIGCRDFTCGQHGEASEAFDAARHCRKCFGAARNVNLAASLGRRILFAAVPKDPCGCGGKCGDCALSVSFRHGLGDAVNFAHLIPLYTARGYRVQVHDARPDRAVLFRAAGAEVVSRADLVHPWPEPRGGNKCRGNLVSPGLPDLADAWDEYAAVKLDLAKHVDDGARQWAGDALARARQPVLALHVAGISGGKARDYPVSEYIELQRLWVERTGGTVVMLDRDGSRPPAMLPGVVHVSGFGPAELYELIRRADVFAGIDSGPLHFARLTDTPTVGIWVNHYPADFALPPRPNTVHVVAARHAARDAKDGATWNTKLAPSGDAPPASFVADVVISMLPASARIAQLMPDELLAMPKPNREPMPLPERHPAVIFPDAISTVARRIREAAESSPYDHRPFLHPGDTDFAAKLTEPFRSGYSALKWAVAKVLQPRAICEIGVGGGMAALAFLDAAPGASYVGVDSCRYEDELGVPLLGHVEEQLARLGRRGRILRQDSKTLKELPGEFDLVHVDGDHSFEACLRDVRLALASGAAWVLVDDARDANVLAATFAAVRAARAKPGECETTIFEDSWTGSILIYTGENLR